ncbi:hypothetical protein LCGC14_3033610 [marine sediment metagenome]|uniref:Uncharacterized protein n=1 Tax=marine sediment metagenome TaxID=412755 RepID=A0A0F8ZHR9_9ZZZZ
MVGNYGLKKNFINFTFGKEIFRNKISREEAYDLVFNYLIENLQESENYREILKQMGGNLITFDNRLDFLEETPQEILKDSIKRIIRFFIDKIRENEEIDFEKFFLNTEQEIYKD